MQLRTREHLKQAERNTIFAERLQSAVDSEPSEANLSPVVASYAAVHFVNAVLNERRTFTSGTHTEREFAIARLRDLRPLLSSYTRLKEHGYQVRHSPNHRVSIDTARSLIDVRLRHVQDVVLNLLHSPEEADSWARRT